MRLQSTELQFFSTPQHFLNKNPLIFYARLKNMAQTILTNLISNSQSAMSAVFLDGNMAPIPIEPWQNIVPFNVPINVLRLGDGSLLTYGNGRLSSTI